MDESEFCMESVEDRAKWCYAQSSELLALMHYRLAELAGTGGLDPNESMLLQEGLNAVWGEVYCGTLASAVEDATDSREGAPGNTYSDGTYVTHKLPVPLDCDDDEPWVHDEFLLEDGAVLEFPIGVVAVIRPLAEGGPSDKAVAEREALRKRLQRPLAGWGA